MDVLDLVAKAGVGAALLAIGSWSIGRLNNAMAVSLSSTRTRDEANDLITITLKLKKGPPTRVRLDGCGASVRIDDVDDDDQAATVAKAITSDMQRTTLVPGDQVQYGASLRVPAGTLVRVCLVVKTTQLVLDRIEAATPCWTSSIAVAPKLIESKNSGSAGDSAES
jgi:hypothetical protein